MHRATMIDFRIRLLTLTALVGFMCSGAAAAEMH